MNSENYILPHMGHAATFPRPRPLLAAIVENYAFPLSLHVNASSIQCSLFEDFGCFASVLLGPLTWLATKAAIAPFPPSLSIEFHRLFPPFGNFEHGLVHRFFILCHYTFHCSRCNSHQHEDHSNTT